MEHEQMHQLMMAALDDELPADGRDRLDAHLRQCADCTREWQAIMAIDRLFRQTPALQPAADFAQRTLARLPDRRYRLWLIAGLYLLLLLSGLLPLAAMAWLVTTVGTALNQPALRRGLSQTAGEAWQLLQILAGAVGQIATAAAEQAQQNPAIIGSLLLMLGIVVVWSGVYRQMVSQPVANRNFTNQ